MRFSSSVAIAVVLFSSFAGPAYAAMGATTDSTDNHRPPELDRTSPTEQSDYEIALRLIRHKQYADAIPHLQFALADKPKDGEILDYLGYAKRMVGNYDDALYYYGRALVIDPNDKQAHENLGELDLAKNDLLSAQKELETLTTLCPSSCDERDALAKAIAGHKPSTSLTPVSATSPAASGTQP
jgi:Flp pilus assembly protein TadD